MQDGDDGEFGEREGPDEDGGDDDVPFESFDLLGWGERGDVTAETVGGTDVDEDAGDEEDEDAEDGDVVV